MTQFKFFIEFIGRVTQGQVTAKFNEQEQFVDLFKRNKQFHIQFEDGAFKYGEILKYDADCEGYVSERTISDAYELLAEI